MKKWYIQLVAILFTLQLVFSACGVYQTTVRKTRYKEFKKSDQAVDLNYTLPKAIPMHVDEQSQMKGDVRVSCEIVPFSLERFEESNEKVSYKNPAPAMQNFDMYETQQKPDYRVTPSNLQFKIRVKNNQDRVIKLIDVPLILMVDGTQTAISEDALVEWKTGMIIKGFEKNFIINGPSLNQIGDSKIVYISVNDIPVAYDAAGNITKKENFEWTYKIESEQITKHDKITYKYRQKPIYKEKCIACSGHGSFKSKEQCSTCEGSGVYKNKKGQVVKCFLCGGAGKVTVERKCSSCGGKGSIAHPKSMLPPIARQEIWKTWSVHIETIPAGASVQTFDIDTEKYKPIGFSNLKTKWFEMANQKPPIILKYNGKQVKVIPYDNTGKAIKKIVVDFNATPETNILFGQKAE